MSRYRCREHPDEHVTWKGTGCQVCERERAEQSSPTPPAGKRAFAEWANTKGTSE